MGQVSVIAHQSTKGLFNLVILGVGEGADSPLIHEEIHTILDVIDFPITSLIQNLKSVVTEELVEYTIYNLLIEIPNNIVGSIFHIAAPKKTFF